MFQIRFNASIGPSSHLQLRMFPYEFPCGECVRILRYMCILVSIGMDWVSPEQYTSSELCRIWLHAFHNGCAYHAST